MQACYDMMFNQWIVMRSRPGADQVRSRNVWWARSKFLEAPAIGLTSGALSCTNLKSLSHTKLLAFGGFVRCIAKRPQGFLQHHQFSNVRNVSDTNAWLLSIEWFYNDFCHFILKYQLAYKLDSCRKKTFKSTISDGYVTSESLTAGAFRIYLDMGIHTS